MPARDRIYTRPRMTAEAIEQTARTVARALSAQAHGPYDAIATWIGAAESLGASVQGYYGQHAQTPGFYDGTRATIYYNLRADAPARIRYLIHELAHHLLAQWPGARFPRRAIERYDDDRQTVQHRVARRVEELLVGESADKE